MNAINKIIMLYAKYTFITCSIGHLHIGQICVHNVHEKHVEMWWHGSSTIFESSFRLIFQILWILVVTDFL